MKLLISNDDGILARGLEILEEVCREVGDVTVVAPDREQAREGKRTVAEGVNTAKAAVELGEQTGIELPIASEIEQILFEGKTPQQAIRDLMERELKAELWR